jgi:hypothetical protein
MRIARGFVGTKKPLTAEGAEDAEPYFVSLRCSDYSALKGFGSEGRSRKQQSSDKTGSVPVIPAKNRR